MNYSQIRKMDISNGSGIGVSLFVSGCPFHCKNCFNKSTWGYDSGKPFTQDLQNEFLDLADKPYIDRITILGGEPMADKNFDDVFELVEAIHARFATTKKIWIYSGYTYEEIYEDNHKVIILPLIDYLVDGRYIDELKDMTLAFRGSSNQKIWMRVENDEWKDITTSF